jgi:hypothetical protein
MFAIMNTARRLACAGTLLTAALLIPSGCGDLLDVEPPDLIPAEGLAIPGNAQLLVNGAIGDFECAFGAYVALSGVMAHEMLDATQTASRWPYDRRNLTPQDSYGYFGCTALGVYTPLSTARWSADFILENLQGWTDQEVEGRQRLVALAAAYSGYSHLLMAEGFCSVAIDLSAELSPQEVTQRAIERFDVAVQAAGAAGASDVQNLARVGRARAYLGLGQTGPALQDAQAVPADFEWVATASGDFSRRANRIFAQNGEGGLYYQRKYTSLADPLPVATGDEARLIVAEIQGGQTAVDIINALHARAGLAPFPGGTEAEIQAHVLEERRRELWLEGHRFFDIRRLNLPLIPEPGLPYRKGGLYGNDRCFPIPDVEVRNNPNVG